MTALSAPFPSHWLLMQSCFPVRIEAEHVATLVLLFSSPPPFK